MLHRFLKGRAPSGVAICTGRVEKNPYGDVLANANMWATYVILICLVYTF